VIATAQSSPEPRWRRQPEERPRQIIEAALDVFSERGLAAARLEDIAKVAGVSKGTIYLYFPNKEALFCEMIRQMIGDSIAQAQDRYSTSAESATDQLREYMTALWEYLRSPLFEKLHRIVTGDLQNYPALLKFFFEEVPQRSMEVEAAIIRRGIASGEFRPVDADAAARMLHALFIQHSPWCAYRERIPFVAHLTDDEVAGQILDFVLHALQPTPNSRTAGSRACT
jgi:AcrR family transcriptional regulator